MLRTKIICTLGPAADDPEVMRGLVRNGMDVARMNFSHGSHDEHLKRLQLFRSVCEQDGIHIPVLLDTKGPEIRIGKFEDGEAFITEGQYFTLTTRELTGNSTIASVNYAGLPEDVQPESRILIDDGLLELRVNSINGDEIHCTALNSGTISDRKSINVPGASLKLPPLTPQDISDIIFAIQNGYDFIAASFVRKKDDVSEIRRILEQNGGEFIRIIAKIENREGVENIDGILRNSDGIMIARGDLGVEIPVEEVPIVQKRMIRNCYETGKPVITATQMLDSMMRNPRPTRAEANDVANAIFDGTSAIMLSGETASGKYPVEALKTMVRIANTTEDSINYWKRFKAQSSVFSSNVTTAISHATCTTSMDLGAAAIVAVTTSGQTARMISRFRPKCPIIGVATSERAMRQLRLSWGVYPMMASVVSSTDDLFVTAVDCARKSGLVEDGDLIVVTAGVPVGMSGTTNMLRVQMLGNILCHGEGIGDKSFVGTVCGAGGEIPPETGALSGEILVIREITPELLPCIRSAKGLIMEGEDKDGSAATLAMALEIPIIVNVGEAMKILKDGTVVSMDAAKGLVQCVDAWCV